MIFSSLEKKTNSSSHSPISAVVLVKAILHGGSAIADELRSMICQLRNVFLVTKDLRPIGEEFANGLLPKVCGWNLVKESDKLKLSQSWTLKTFTKGLELFQAVADVAEAKGVAVLHDCLLTKSQCSGNSSGLTENDFMLAAKINNLDLDPLLRIKPTNFITKSLTIMCVFFVCILLWSNGVVLLCNRELYSSLKCLYVDHVLGVLGADLLTALPDFQIKP
ncbi:hypothetical protein Cgig2_029721 [Carnegiea gigantea]|uniref:4a-hydroxytetrahydrobiopterin dehydratase n=1 Tax=Carnegiea gigantea TaxID=171969 RepID=A0A9Q1QEB5_9CARY|nr:hypothetical protein Cgig2_029721 [Carnegiea gigantea]